MQRFVWVPDPQYHRDLIAASLISIEESRLLLIYCDRLLHLCDAVLRPLAFACADHGSSTYYPAASQNGEFLKLRAVPDSVALFRAA